MSLQLSQQLRQSQRLVMTPQMQQSIALLQMNSLELEQHLEGELLENPFLEIADNGEENDQLVGSEGEGDRGIEEAKEGAAPEDSGDGPTAESDNRDTDSAELNGNSSDGPETEFETKLHDQDAIGSPEDSSKDKATDDDPGAVDIDFEALFDDTEPRLNTSSIEHYEEANDFTTYTPKLENLYDHLKKQLPLSILEGKEVEVAEYIIGLLNEDGYLHTPIEDIAEEFEMETPDVVDILAVVQEFDPPGIAARSLEECLMLQMEDQGMKDRDYYRVVNHQFKLLQSKKFKEAAKESGVPEDKIAEIFHYVVHLDPHPGRRYSTEETRYVKPDVYVKEIDGEYIYFLKEGRTGKLRINQFYKDILSKGDSWKGEEKDFAMGKFKNAVWLIKNIEKRKGTVLRVTEAIMNFQSEFLDKGVEALRPLTLKEIAAMVDMHESTIARVTTGKYVETPRGTFELKYFFSSGLETEDGGDTSSRAIKERIKHIIGDEDPKKPLSDQKIANILQEEGLKIARRTVAKYREQMKFLPAKLRKAV